MSPVPPCAVNAWLGHRDELLRFVERRVQDRAVAEDVLQDVFLKAARPASRFCEVQNHRAWLFEVARNLVIDRQRTAKPVVEVPADLPAVPAATAPVDALADCVERVLGELAPGDADILRRCDLMGMTLNAYAAAASITLPAAKSRVQRARRRLRALLVRNCQVILDDQGRVCCHTPRPHVAAAHARET